MKKMYFFLLSMALTMLLSSTSWAQCVFQTQTFDSNPVLSATNVNGAWHPDRYAPNGFVADGGRLKISINPADGAQNRPGAFTGAFYNTQGRKFNQCGTCVTELRGDLYIPADWLTNKRRSEMWATAYNASNTISGYPIIGFRNVDGNSANAQIYYYDINTGLSINTGVTVTGNTWYNLKMRLSGTNLIYSVNNTDIVTIASNSSTYFGDIIMQAYNFNDNRLNGGVFEGRPEVYDGTPNNAYDAFWDNLVITVPGVTNTNTGKQFCTIQAAINDAATIAGHTIEVSSGTYNEQVLVNKGVKILGVGATKPIVDFTGTVAGKATSFDISADGVTIENINFKVDMSKLRSAIIASAAGIDNITVKDNLIEPYGTPAGTYGERNAVSVNYAAYRVATGGVNNVTFTGNTVTYNTGASSGFRAGIAVDEGGGTFSGNTLQTINHDILVRFASNGAVNITGNNFNGGGVELSDQNAAAGTFTVSGNTFNATFANVSAPGAAVLRVKNNYNSIAHNISSNIFTNFDWAMSLENMNAITLNGNTFTGLNPTSRAVVFNTKSISSNSNTIVQVPVALTMTNNTFGGTGTALSFLNHDSDNDSYGTFTLGTVGNENTFAATLSNFIFLDGQTGGSGTSTFPTYPNTGQWPTTMACWDQNLDIKNNKFDVGAGLQLPQSMNLAQRTALEGKLDHKPDVACKGLLQFFLPVHNLTQNTYFGTIQAAVTAANASDVIECSEGTYNEAVTIDKSLTLQGINANKALQIIDGTGLASPKSGIRILNGITSVTIKNFTIQNFAGASGNADAGIYAIGGNNNLIVDNVALVNNTNASGFYANGPVSNVTVTNSTVSNHITGARGIVIWNGFKQGITITNNNLSNNNCCGIELQEGTASNVNVSGNTIDIGVGDNAIGITGLNNSVGPNLINNNIITGGGRFGIEIKNPAGGVTVSGNNVTLTTQNANLNDRAGIAVFRRVVQPGNVDVPNGVTITGNTVTGYQQSSTSEGFGIVIEGTNHSVTGNTLTGNDVGILQQQNPSNYPGDADQSNVADQYFGRGNSPITCGNTISGNTFSGNTTDTRNIGVGAGLVTNTNTNEYFCSIQAAIDDAQTIAGHTITVAAGTYNEDVVVNKQLTINGAGIDVSYVVGPIGGGGATFQVAAAGVVINGFTITRAGNNTTDWNNSGLNSAGISIQSQGNTAEIKNNKITGNRTGIDVNNSNGNDIHNNIITSNRTGLIFRNQTDNTTLIQNEITDNWTVGIVFLDASMGTNSPVQTATSSSFNNNKITGNWYGGIVDRQTGGSLPAPGANLKNFNCNWYGSLSPVVTTSNSAEPPYAGQIPVAYGGMAANPGGAPDIAGPASANIAYVPFLSSGIDHDGGAIGFQPVPGSCTNCVGSATISPTTSICSGTGTTITFTGTPNTSITYNINGGSDITIGLDGAGNASVPTGNLTATTTYNLVSGTNGLCTSPLSGSAVITTTVHSISLTSAAATESQITCLNAPITSITYALGSGATGVNVTGLPNGITASVNGNVLTISGSSTITGTFNYSIVTTGNACPTATESGTIIVNPKPVVTLTVNGQTFNEGNNPVLCDTDANPVNTLTPNVTTSCIAGAVVWRTKMGAGDWSAWSTTAPSSQPSDNTAYQYQAACEGLCPATITNPISLTINYRASTPQNVSLVADGTTVIAGQSASICDVDGNTITFNATCAAGEMVLYSVDGGEYSTTVPLQIVDGNFHNYRIRCRKADNTPSCIESESAAMSLKISPIPSTPTVSISPTDGCGAPVAFTGTSSCGVLATIWYNATTNQSLASLPATTPTATTSFYARCQNEAGCLSGNSNTVTYTVTPVNEAPVITVSSEIVCTGTSVTLSANCPAGATAFWNTGVTENSFTVAFSNVTTQTYWAKCIFPNGCQSAESIHKSVLWKAFDLTFINIGQSQSGSKPANDKALWASQFITKDAGPVLENSTESNPTIYYSENVNKTAPRFWTIQVETCALGTNGSVTYDMLANPEVGVVRSYNTHENNAPYLMYANREGFTELYAQNHPAYGFYQDNGSGGNTYDAGLPKGLYKLSVRYWDQKGQGSIYPSTRQPAGNVLAYQEYWFRIQSQSGVGAGAARESAMSISAENSFAEVMPNPVSNTLRLKVNDAKGQKVNTTLVDASGRPLLQRSFVPQTNHHQEEFEVSQLTNGMYFIQVKTAEKQTTLKVIKVE